jgi:hypothetical protein
MLDRVVVDVIHVSRQIKVIPNLMLPISPLPNTSLPLRMSTGTDHLIAFR